MPNWVDDLKGKDIAKAGTTAPPRRGVLNFIEGAGVSITVADNTTTQRTDVTIAASGSGASVDYVASVRLATTANHGLSGLAAIDGVTPVAGDRILVWKQTTGNQNGIYVAAAGAWARATDFDISAESTSGALVWVSEGTANGGELFALETADPITLGTTALTFRQVRYVKSGHVQNFLGEVDVQRQGASVLKTTSTRTTTYDPTGVGQTHLEATFWQVSIGGSQLYVDANQVSGNNNYFFTTASYRVGDSVSFDTASVGAFRGPKATTLLAGRNNAETGDIWVARTNSTDELFIGDDADATNLYLQAATSVVIRRGLTPYATFEETAGRPRVLLDCDIEFKEPYTFGTPSIGYAASVGDAVGSSLTIEGQDNNSATNRAGGVKLNLGTNAGGGPQGILEVGNGVGAGLFVEAISNSGANVALGTARPSSWNSGIGVSYFRNRNTAPTAGDANGVFAFAESGSLQHIGSASTQTALAPA